VDLGHTTYGKKILGIYHRNPRAILIDRVLDGDSRFSFTLAHEIGHFVFHREFFIQNKDYNDMPDTIRDLVTGRRKLITEKQWIEWQANTFASAFLLPRATFEGTVAVIQEAIGVAKNLGVVYVEESPSSISEYMMLLDGVAKVYDVHRRAVEIRLSSLEMLIDQRLRGKRHISQLLSEETINSDNLPTLPN
jgi:Zn-dependent peptidase ImmA (M78 family)